MAKNLEHLREKAREWYTKGMSLPDICLHLNRSKGTVHYWLRGLERHSKATAFVKAAALAASRINSLKAQERKVLYRLEAEQHLPRLISDPFFRDFIMLYLTEGTRKCHAGCTVAVANSNPRLIILATKFIREFIGEPEFSFQYHDDQNPKQLCEFWAEQVGTTPDKVIPRRKSNSGGLSGRTWACKYGVLTVRRGSVRVRTMLEVWMNALQEMW